MPEYDYTIDDIQSVEMNLRLSHLPDAHADVTYRVHLKNGETRDEEEATVTGVLAAAIAMFILEIKGGLREQEAAPQPERQRAWRQNRA